MTFEVFDKPSKLGWNAEDIIWRIKPQENETKWDGPPLHSWNLLLPPANEVWGKVIFLLACVILFTGGSLFRGRGLCPGRVSVQLGLCPGGLCQGDATNGKERAVRTLLECIPVQSWIKYCVLQFLTELILRSRFEERWSILHFAETELAWFC